MELVTGDKNDQIYVHIFILVKLALSIAVLVNMLFVWSHRVAIYFVNISQLNKIRFPF